MVEWNENRIFSPSLKDDLDLGIPKDKQEEKELDVHGLIFRPAGSQAIKPHHHDWYLSQAAKFKELDRLEREIAKLPGDDPQALEMAELVNRLGASVLNHLDKVATVLERRAAALGIQSSPILPGEYQYHRSTMNVVLETVQDRYAEVLGLHPGELYLLEGPLFSEVLAREMPQALENMGFDSLDAFQEKIGLLTEMYLQGKEVPTPITFDFGPMLDSSHLKPEDIEKEIVGPCEKIFIACLEEKINSLDFENEEAKAAFQKRVANDFASNVHLLALAKEDENPVLLLPRFLIPGWGENSELFPPYLNTSSQVNRAKKIHYKVNDAMVRSGFRPNPKRLRNAWLGIQSLRGIFDDVGISPATLYMDEIKKKDSDGLGQKVGELPTVSDVFLSQLAIKFSILSKSAEQPVPAYLEVLPQATSKLLQGLVSIKQDGMGVDDYYASLGLSELLQMSYARIVNAMQESIFRKDSPIDFLNQIEIIHQEIQDILSIMRPYTVEDFRNIVIGRMCGGENPIIPGSIPQPDVHLKASAMHCLSSILSAVEEQKGSNKLNVVVQQDSYYESSDTAQKALTHTTYNLAGDAFRQGEAVDLHKVLDPYPEEPIDLFICELHHNISVERREYYVENVRAQITALAEADLLAEKVTVAIDCTIDLDASPDIQDLLSDPGIQKLINDGRLNLVLYRSAQKFDMLGMDNYYGGLSLSLNQGDHFSEFNQRMQAKGDDLEDLNMQGVCHIQAWAGWLVDSYREAIMSNTHSLFNSLPEEMKYREDSSNPIQVSQIHDPRCVFLDIKFGADYSRTANRFRTVLKLFAKKEGLPFTARASFGFATTNFSVIDGKKLRLNPGLDGEETLSQYSKLFNEIQDCIDGVLAKVDDSKNFTDEDLDKQIATALDQLAKSYRA